MPTPKPLCFVLMPFGKKKDPTGLPDIDFNRIYRNAIEPAIKGAGMVPVRADEEKTGGIIHKPMFERLLLCEYAVADLTTANANVFYELGIRHTARPCTTQPIFAQHQPIPFDVNFLRALPYELGKDNAFGPRQAAALRRALTGRLSALRKIAVDRAPVDSPVFQLIENWKPDLAHLRSDLFREQLEASEEIKQQMVQACSGPAGAARRTLRKIEKELGLLDTHEAGIMVNLMLAYRSVEGWTELIELYERMPDTLKRQMMVREQLAFALERRAEDQKAPIDVRTYDRRRALEVLEAVEAETGPNPETCGLIGRVYKALWTETAAAGDPAAEGHLDTAIAAYVRGFEADPRDFYPGLNAATLFEVKGGREAIERRNQILPVVRFAAERKLRQAHPDYWDYATMLEISVLESDWTAARKYTGAALARVKETFQPKTTANNLRLIGAARKKRGEAVAEIESIVADFTKGFSRGLSPDPRAGGSVRK